MVSAVDWQLGYLNWGHLVHHWMNGLTGETIAWPVVGVHIRQVILGHACFFGALLLLFFINFVIDGRGRGRGK
jgi:hypothetical protein